MDKINALILAAGKGTRMNSDLPKVVHRCAGETMVHYVITAAREAGCEDVCVIVGYKAEVVKEEIKENVSFAMQTEQLGTGHAVKCAIDYIGTTGSTIVLCGDTPLITGATLKRLVEKHNSEGNGVTVLSAILEDSTGYGRIIRNVAGEFVKIVEQKDATEKEKEVKEINSGMYIFDSAALTKSLGMISNNNAAGEYYLTDTIGIIRELGLPIAAMPLTGAEIDEIRGVNTPVQLAEAEEIMKNR